MNLHFLARVARWFLRPRWLFPRLTTQNDGDFALTTRRGPKLAAGWHLLLVDVEGGVSKGASPWLNVHYDDRETTLVSLPLLTGTRFCRVLHFPAPVTKVSLGLPTAPRGQVRAHLWRAGPAWLALWLGFRRFGLRGALPGLLRTAMTMPRAPHTAMGRWLISDGTPAAPLGSTTSYEGWIRDYDTPSPEDRARMRQISAALPHRPLISVIMPVYQPDPDLLAAAITSVRRQVYDRWELCIADDCSPSPEVRELLRAYADDTRIRVVFRETNGHISAASNSALALASGEYIALLDHDDLLPEHALFTVAQAINAHPEADLFYSDEDKLDSHGQRYDPYFKPDWNRALFLGQNMISHLGVYRRSLVQEVGGFREGFEGSQDYDLALRVIERSSDERIVHIPHVLYHWRAIAGSTALEGSEKSYAWDAGRRALEEHLARAGQPLPVGRANHAFYHVPWPQPDPAPLVSVLIPTRDRLDLLAGCIDGLRDRTDYPAWEAIIIDNGSVEPETLRYLDDLVEDQRFRVLRVDAPFNYSLLNNMAAEIARGELLCLLNNDIVMIEPGWLSEMVAQMRPGVGVVGAKLLYADGRVQHAGVIIGLGGVAGHYHLLLAGHEPGYFGRAELVQDLSAVTGACLLIPAALYRDVGGLDTELAVAFNDVDLCLRVRKKGWRIIWTPHARLYHLESASRGSDMTEQNRARFENEVALMQSRWGTTLDDDPFHNPNLSNGSPVPMLATPPRIHAPWALPQEGN